jgi:excisionase family DNA binding protein
MTAKIKLATAQEVAVILRLKEDTVCSLASKGKLPGFKIGKSWRFDKGRLEGLFAEILGGGNARPDDDQEHNQR